MRFDDRLNTALSQPFDTQAKAKTQWVQLVDLLSQPADGIKIETIAHGLQRLRQLMDIVPSEARLSGVKSIMGRLQSPPLLQLLAGDMPKISSCAISAAKFKDDQWAALIPTLPNRARGFLRNRDDLGPKSMKALSIWASADFVLPSYYEEALVLDDEALVLDDSHLVSGAGDTASSSDADIKHYDAHDLDLQNDEPDNDSQSEIMLRPNMLVGKQDNEIELVDGDDPNNGDSLDDTKRQRIDEIVEKIEKLRHSRENFEAPQLPLEGGVEGEVDRLTEIYFATDDQGTINWVDGAPRGALVGTSLAEPSYDHTPGPDASGAAAFKQRITLENARMKLCGPDMINGDWRINAAPFFNVQTGRFKGYKGLLRRPNLFETARYSDHTPSTFDNGNSDNLQQLIHELRTPLGAVIGFAEIIEQQLFGPASSEYRVLAKTILEEGNRLLSGFDDLNVAAKIDSGIFQASLGVTDCNWLMGKVLKKLEPLIKSQSIAFNYIENDNIKPLAIENDDAERLLMRLLSSLVIASTKDERVNVRWESIGNSKPMNQLSVSLPDILKNMSEKQLLESGPEIKEDNINAPLLGLGFSLRLVRNLANNIGGGLRFEKDFVILNLPASRENIIKNNGLTID